MKAATIAAIILFVVVAAAHLARLVWHVEVAVAGRLVPMWVSVAGLIIPAALALALWREH